MLKDDDHSVRGSAAWGLCQIGGKDAQDALLAFLRTSLTSRNWGDLTRATEAQKELPDASALDLLIKCLHERNGHHKDYAAEALGKIGDPKASLSLAQQLDLNIEYSMSRDYLYLTAIRETKGKDATPLLIDYLERLVIKMVDQNLDDHPIIIGRAPRQINYNFQIYGLTLAALEAVTHRKSSTGTREDVAQDWKKWWKEKSSEADPAADRPRR